MGSNTPAWPRIRGLLLCLFVCVLPAGAWAADYAIDLSEHGTLILDLPAGLERETHSPGPGLPPTVVFRPPAGQPFVFLMTPIWMVEGGPEKPTLDMAREAAEQGAASLLSQAEEDELPLQPLTGRSAEGYWFRATDRDYAPGKADDYKYLDQGVVVVGSLAVTFTMLSNEGQQGIAERVIEGMGNTRHQAPR